MEIFVDSNLISPDYVAIAGMRCNDCGVELHNHYRYNCKDKGPYCDPCQSETHY